MNNNSRQLYEGMFIISPTLSDDARKKALERITEVITQRNGEILKVHDWGRRRLAYAIDGHNDGHYFILYFEITPTSIPEAWQEFHLNEDLIRFMTLTTDKVMEKIEFPSLSETS